MDGIELKREERICGQCGLREVEGVEHFVLRYGGLVREREVLMKRMAEVTAGLEKQGDAGCRDLKQGKPLSACGGRGSVLRSSHRQVYWCSPTPSPVLIH